MKRDYILIFGGLVPFLFSIFVINFFLKDDRKELFESAKILQKSNLANLSLGELVKFSGVISKDNPKLKDEYVLAVREVFKKGQNGKRSEWIKEELFLQPIKVNIPEFETIEVTVANDYLPCGDLVKISDSIPKKSRVLGIPDSVSVSAVGKITSISPIKIQTAHSLCTGTIENYEEYLNKKFWGYLLVLLCISVPSLGVMYLGFFRGINNETDSVSLNE
jgi:hypothetical protein